MRRENDLRGRKGADFGARFDASRFGLAFLVAALDNGFLGAPRFADGRLERLRECFVFRDAMDEFFEGGTGRNAKETSGERQGAWTPRSCIGTKDKLGSRRNE